MHRAKFSHPTRCSAAPSTVASSYTRRQAWTCGWGSMTNHEQHSMRDGWVRTTAHCATHNCARMSTYISMLPLAASTCSAGRVQGAVPCPGSCMYVNASRTHQQHPPLHHHAQHKQPYAPAHIPNQAILTCPAAPEQCSHPLPWRGLEVQLVSPGLLNR